MLSKSFTGSSAALVAVSEEIRYAGKRPAVSSVWPYGLGMRPIPGVTDWRSFEKYARQYFSNLWTTELTERSVSVADTVPWRFDLV